MTKVEDLPPESEAARVAREYPVLWANLTAAARLFRPILYTLVLCASLWSLWWARQVEGLLSPVVEASHERSVENRVRLESVESAVTVHDAALHHAGILPAGAPLFVVRPSHDRGTCGHQ